MPPSLPPLLQAPPLPQDGTAIAVTSLAVDAVGSVPRFVLRPLRRLSPPHAPSQSHALRGVEPVTLHNQPRHAPASSWDLGDAFLRLAQSPPTAPPPPPPQLAGRHHSSLQRPTLAPLTLTPTPTAPYASPTALRPTRTLPANTTCTSSLAAPTARTRHGPTSYSFRTPLAPGRAH